MGLMLVYVRLEAVVQYLHRKGINISRRALAQVVSAEYGGSYDRPFVSYESWARAQLAPFADGW